MTDQQQKIVLFVCTANQCRSPMAEYLLRARLGPDTEWHVLSAGVAAIGGLGASNAAMNALAEVNIDLGPHATRPITAQLVEMTTVLVAMTEDHRDEILRRFPDAAEKVFLLRSFGTDKLDRDVIDPAGMSLAEYRETRNLIDSELSDLILFLQKQ